jgi:hypothetical protein
LITQNNWWQGLPDIVQDFVKAEDLQHERLSKEDSDWRCAYTLDNTGDREVAGACVFGPLSSGVLMQAQAIGKTQLMICVASAAMELTSTTIAVLVLDEDVQDCLTACGINSQLYRKIDDGFLRIDSGYERSHEE